MTSLQLASMIARRTVWKTLAEMPMEDANALCAAVNQALQVWFERAGAAHASVQRFTQLRGPVVCKATLPHGETRIAFDHSAPGWLADAAGVTVRIEGDPRWNKLLAPSLPGQPGKLLHAFAGETGQNHNVTVYQDCAPLGNGTVSVCSQVRLLLSGGREVVLSGREIPGSGQSLGQGDAHRIGTPDRYQVEPLNPGANWQRLFTLRVWPLPSVDMTLSYRVTEHFDLSTADLQLAKALPVPEDVASGIILPIALDRAAGQGLLAKDTDVNRLAADAATAMERIGPRTMLPTTETQWMGTLSGY